MTDSILFSGDDRLEGILEWPDAAQPSGAAAGIGAPAQPHPVAGGVVIAHPHPLYGGTMAQPVVFRVARACRDEGFAALRFNFRGVGRSGGHYSGVDEHRDVEAALAYLRGRLPQPPGGRRAPLGLAGYSFGSMMAALAAGSSTVPVDALALIAFVVDWEEAPPGVLDGLSAFKGPVLALCGETDDLAPPEVVDHALRRVGVDYRLTVLQGTGHFFEHRQKEVGEHVAAFFAETLGAGHRPGLPR